MSKNTEHGKGRRREIWVNGMHFPSLSDGYAVMDVHTPAHRAAVKAACEGSGVYTNQDKASFRVSLIEPESKPKEWHPKEHHLGEPLIKGETHRIGHSESRY